MNQHRLTPNFAEDIPPPRAVHHAARKPLRVAGMDLPIIVILYGMLCGLVFIGPNVHDKGLNPKHWKRDRLYLGNVAAEGLRLTITLLGFDLALRTGRKPEGDGE